MKLTVVGCSGSFPGPESAASCYLLEHDGYTLVLDLGNGSLGQLARYMPIDELDAVVLSHLHVDHCADIGPLYVTRRYHPGGIGKRIPILGPVGMEDRANGLYGINGGKEDLTSAVEFVEYGSDPIEFGPFTIEPFAVVHCVSAFALRVSAGGKTLVYSGDTGPCEQLVEAAMGADLALFEASYLERNDNPMNMHLTGADAAKAATAAGVGRLVLTHLVPWNDNEDVVADAAPHFSGDLIVAHAGLTLTV